MWFFGSPFIVHGSDAIEYLQQLTPGRALVVTDQVVSEMGISRRVAQQLQRAGCVVHEYAGVEPEPGLESLHKGVERAEDVQPKYVVAVGGGSVIDAAKAIALLYEYPDLAPAEISPIIDLQLRKTQLVAIPTTSGTGSEATWALVLTDTNDRRKLSLANRAIVPSLAIVDPALTQDLPPALTAETGLDALAHAIEGYTATWHNDFSDGLCLKACHLVFSYLPRAYTQGNLDTDAREHMANAATIAGLGFGNANAALAHAMGHSLGALFNLAHGRAVAICLPHTIEYSGRHTADRYADIERMLARDMDTPAGAPHSILAARIRRLMAQVDLPTSLAQAGITHTDFSAALPTLCDHAEMDTQMLCAPRIPDRAELQRLFEYSYSGRSIDF